MSLVDIFVTFVPIITAIILHELAHGYTAYKLGDNTAKYCGRLSFNPLKHADLFGTIILPALLFFSKVGFIFGWAKPVPVNFNNLRHYKRDMLLVSAAGIVMNIFLAAASAIILKLLSFLPQSTIQGILGLFFLNMVVFNIVLAAFNALPFPPLDGSKIFFGWIEKNWAQKYVSSEKGGMAAIIILAFIIPSIGKNLGFDWNILGWYLIKTTQYFASILL